MKVAIGCLIGVLLVVSVDANPLLEGRVRLDSGTPVPGAQVLLFDLSDLRTAPLAATTDRSGHFTLPLAALAGARPERFELGANYPNPFNPSTMIPYQLPAAMHVRLEVFNLLGQRIATLVDGERPAGLHTASWDATDAKGQAVAAGVYLYRLSGDGVQATRSMVLIDGQAGGAAAGPVGPSVAGVEAVQTVPVYGLTVSGPGLVPYVDPAFRVEAATASLDIVVEAPGRGPSAKVASGGILGDVDNTGRVDFFDALLVALYSLDASVVMPNNGDLSLGDVNADGQVDLSDAWLIAAYLNDPSDPALPAGIGQPVGAALASLSPDPSTVTFSDDGAWHRFTVEAGEPVSVVANPGAATPRLEITTRSGRGNYCPAEADDDASRQDGQTLYLSGCATGPATVELRREADGKVLQTYTFEVTGSPADLVVESVSVSDSTLTPGKSFTLSAMVHNQGTAGADATTLRYYRSSNRTISTQDTQVGTDVVSALAASGSTAESINLTAPSTEGTYYYGACVESVTGERGGNNCSTGVRLTVASSPDLIVESPSVSDNRPETGASFTLRATVRNQGTGPSPSTILRYYLSSNTTISTGDTEVGTDAVSALSPAGASNDSLQLTAPSSPGTYYYGACVQSVPGESASRNNCSSAVTVESVIPETRTPQEARTELSNRGIPYSKTSFVGHAKDGNLDVVKLFLTAGMDVNVRNDDNHTAVMRASYGGHLEMVRYLVVNGAEHLSIALSHAAFRGHLAILLFLSERGADLGSGGAGGWTPLIWAAYAGHLEVVRYLVGEGYDDLYFPSDNRWGDRALLEAARGGHLEVVRFLVGEGFEINPRSASGSPDTPLIFAAHGGHLEVVRFLVESGADIHTRTRPPTRSRMECSGGTGHHFWYPSDTFYDSFDKGCTALISATEQRHIDVAAYLIDRWMSEAGADDSDAFGATALMFAAQIGDLGQARALVDNGADLNAETRVGFNAFLLAVHAGNLEMIRLFLDLGSDINHQSAGGSTALMFASYLGNLETVRLLLDSGADIDTRTGGRGGHTALMAAAFTGHLDVVRLLVEYGADVAITDVLNYTALYWARAKGHQDVATYLASL